MRKDKDEAFQLRRTGKSYSEISASLKIPRATLSGWFGKEDWSEKIKQKLSKSMQQTHTVRLRELNQIRGSNLELVYNDARNEAREEFENLKYNPLFIAGLMLYWGEGDKVNPNGVKFTNTDAKMIKLYVFFLKNVCRVPLDKIKGQVLIYPDLDEPACRGFWSENSGLPIKNFTKTTVITGRHKTNRLANGICLVTVSSSYFKVKILEWIGLFAGELMNRRYYENI